MEESTRDHGALTRWRRAAASWSASRLLSVGDLRDLGDLKPWDGDSLTKEALAECRQLEPACRPAAYLPAGLEGGSPLMSNLAGLHV